MPPTTELLNEATIGAGRWRAGAADRRPGQRIQIWVLGGSSATAPQQLSALKIKITANAVAGEDAGACEPAS